MVDLIWPRQISPKRQDIGSSRKNRTDPSKEFLYHQDNTVSSLADLGFPRKGLWR